MKPNLEGMDPDDIQAGSDKVEVDEDTRGLDAFSYYEVVDRADSIQQMFSTLIEAHPVLDAHPELAEQAEALLESMHAFYCAAVNLMDAQSPSEDDVEENGEENSYKGNQTSE